jgi:large subunit ribosomal protein L22
MADVAVKQNTKTLVRASARSLHISPRKMRLVTNLVKNMRVSEAITQLSFTNKKGAKYLARLLQSAVANAENNFSLKAEDMFVKSVTCDMGQTMKRYFPRARGSAFIIRRKMAHVNVVLEERSGKVAKKQSRFNLLKRTKKTPATVTQEGSIGKIDQITETPAGQDNADHKPGLVKTNEQVKMNKVQNKRRLFNRRIGE